MVTYISFAGREIERLARLIEVNLTGSGILHYIGDGIEIVLKESFRGTTTDGHLVGSAGVCPVGLEIDALRICTPAAWIVIGLMPGEPLHFATGSWDHIDVIIALDI